MKELDGVQVRLSILRNDKSPLILTAYHCTFEYTPQYDLWRFDLQYKSDACVNPEARPQFSLTGCQLKASGQDPIFIGVVGRSSPCQSKVTSPVGTG
jgi:hypothetical protein